MHKRIFVILFFCALVAGAQETKQINVGPAFQKLLDDTNRDASANFVTACLDVTREAARKRLTIYAVFRTDTGIIKIKDYEVEVIYHRELAKVHADESGAYHHHHNGQVLSFAAAQYASGDKELGLRLMKLLYDAQPGESWSSPNHDTMSLKKILEGLEKDDGTARQFLKEETENWEYRVKTYGPKQ